jgi:type IX secretion system PorP/SprF family membrane protein
MSTSPINLKPSNRKKMKYTIAIAMIFLGALNLSAQQEGFMGQMLMNKLTLNPGYAGYRERPILTFAHRQQWTGFAGAPMTTVISYDRPLSKSSLAMGTSLGHTRMGPTTASEFNGYFAVRTRLNNRATISWGMNAGVNLFQANLTGLRNTADSFGQQDETLLTNSRSELVPQIGFGCYYFTQGYYFGVSMPKLVKTKSVIKSDFTEKSNVISEKSAYIMGGKSHKVKRDLMFTYNGFMIASPYSPITVGTFATAVVEQKYTLGAYYILAQSAGVYSYDVSTNALIRTNFGSHEISFNYLFKNKVKRATYPRFF